MILFRFYRNVFRKSLSSACFELEFFLTEVLGGAQRLRSTLFDPEALVGDLPRHGEGEMGRSARDWALYRGVWEGEGEYCVSAALDENFRLLAVVLWSNPHILRV